MCPITFLGSPNHIDRTDKRRPEGEVIGVTTYRSSQPGSLSGLRVVDLSRVLAGPLCTQMLADHGADVIKVEPPAGDDTRSWGPPFLGPDLSAYFSGVNRNKSNICIDLGVSQGQQVLAELLQDADVLVENFKVGTLARWGFSDEMLQETFPKLVHCRITGFGIDGPMGAMPGYDAIVQAYSGLMSVNGEPDRPALRIGVPVVDMVTGSYAFSGILLALHDRHRTGQGQLVDCTLIDTAISLLHPHSSANLADGRIPVRSGSAHPTIAPYDTFEAADGPIFIGTGNDHQFGRLCDALRLSEVAADSRFRTNADRLANIAVLRPLVADRVGQYRRHDLAKELLASGVPASALHDVDEALRDSHVRHRQMVTEYSGGLAVGIPVKLSRTPGSLRTAPRDRGADTLRILAGLGYSEEEIEGLIVGGAAQSSGDDTQVRPVAFAPATVAPVRAAP